MWGLAALAAPRPPADPADLAPRPVVLVVEDDPALADLLTELLTVAGYQAVGAGDGATGIQLARALRPALILLDLQLPRQDGHAVLAALAADPQTRAIPVVVVSGSAGGLRPTPQVRAVVGKPFDVGDLLATVARLSAAA